MNLFKVWCLVSWKPTLIFSTLELAEFRCKACLYPLSPSSVLTTTPTSALTPSSNGLEPLEAQLVLQPRLEAQEGLK